MIKIVSSVILTGLFIFNIIKIEKPYSYVWGKDMKRSFTVKVEGVTYLHCKRRVREGLLTLKGIKEVDINLNTKLVAVNDKGFSENEILKKINYLGYTPQRI